MLSNVACSYVAQCYRMWFEGLLSHTAVKYIGGKVDIGSDAVLFVDTASWLGKEPVRTMEL